MSRFARALLVVLVAGCGEPAPGGADAMPPSLISPERVMNIAAPGGTWYLVANNFREQLDLQCDASLACTGTITDESSGTRDVVDHVRWSADGTLAFRRAGVTGWCWFHTRVVEGVMVGRYARSDTEAGEPSSPLAYDAHVTGWNAEYADRDLAPRVWDLLLDNNLQARLRLDRDPDSPSNFAATLKIYGSIDRHSGETDDYDASVDEWDGTHLGYTVHAPEWTARYTARVAGRFLLGTWVREGSALTHSLRGTRAEVLSHGFATLTGSGRAAWQAHTRRALAHLSMGGNPQPLSRAVSSIPSAPIPSVAPPPSRDDGDPRLFPQAYRMTEWSIGYTLADPSGPRPIERRSHGFLAVPTNAPSSPNGYPLVIALNGHTGSAHGVMNPDDEDYWYGDSFARHGYVVLAVDISHRPPADRRGLYLGSEDGDDPGNGNGPHPAVHSMGLDSDWEEDGERTWDVLRAIDYGLTLPRIDTTRVAVAGLSMGGEIATWAAALDPRVAMTISAGFSPDWSVLVVHGSHGCWQWTNADIREYLDPSDLHALIAPRPLVVETGKVDWTYSWRPEPWASDKQIVRRSRAAYADAPGNLVHYLHYDKHHFHAGGENLSAQTQLEVRAPLEIAPAAPWSVAWQTNGDTIATGMDLFLLARWLAE